MKRVLADKATVAHYWVHQRQPEGRTSSGNMSFQGPVLYSYGLRIGLLVEHNGQTIALTLAHGPTTTTNGKHLPAMRGATSHMFTLPVSTIPDTVPIRSSWVVEELENAIAEVRKEQKHIANKRKGLTYVIDWYNNVFAHQKRHLMDFISNQPIGDGLSVRGYELLQELDEILPLPELDKLKEKAKATAAKERETRKLKDAKDKALFEESLLLWKANESTHLRRYGKYPERTYLRLQGSPPFVETSKGVAIPLDEAKQAYLAFKKGRLLGQKLAGYTITQVDTARQVVIAGCHTVPFSEIEEIGGKL